MYSALYVDYKYVRTVAYEEMLTLEPIKCMWYFVDILAWAMGVLI